MSNYQLTYVKMRAINQPPLTYVADEIYEEVLTPYHIIFGRNIDDNCTINFNEMGSDNVRANIKPKVHGLSPAAS